MADRTSYTLTVPIADLTPQTIDALTDCLSAGNDPDDIEATDTYLTTTINERCCGETIEVAHEVARILTDADQDRPFEVWEAPKYEWLGHRAHHTPGRDLFTADCDGEGTPVVYPGTIASICEETTADAMRARLLAAIGTTHAAALAQALAPDA